MSTPVLGHWRQQRSGNYRRQASISENARPEANLSRFLAPLSGPRFLAPAFWPSYIERFNLTVRTHNPRFTRLTNGHSKSLKHHKALQAIFVAWYNFSRKHETLKAATPAMASGLTDAVWTVRELLERAAQV